MDRIKSIIIILLTFLLFACSDRSKTFDEVVLTTEGQVKGIRDRENGIVVFKGIPYAASPVGDLRWKTPQTHEKWEGVLECTTFGPAAMQPDPNPFLMWTEEFIAPAEKMSEDCLYLNIWSKATSSEEKRPVILYIHGGAFSSGSGAVPIYNGKAMAEKGIVFVTINYRLGIFGFFAHPELTAESPHHASGNYGLLDQVAALKWIAENIKAFGGDPGNVTIAGQSAGAFSVNFLVASPLAKGLFHKAIAESGGAVLPTNRFAENQTLENAEKDGDSLLHKLGIKNIAELRAVSAEDLLKARIYTGPIVDGYFLPASLYTIFQEGKQNDVPVLTGWNANEGIFGGPPVNAETFRINARKEYGDQANEFLALFPAETEQEAEASQKLLGGLKIFGLQAFAWLTVQNATGTKPVYMYHFKQRVPFGKGQKDYGAFHSGEISYAYGNLDKSPVRPWQESDYQLEALMTGYWSEFARTGNPNFEGAPEWEKCIPPDFKTMILGENPHPDSLPYLDQLRFLQAIYERQLTGTK